MASTDRYLAPGRFTRATNRLVIALTRVGLNVKGGRLLAVRGRKSGDWQTVPVNPVTLGGERYLVAPRGQTQWVRNLRAAGAGELRVGRRTEPFTAVELADADKLPVLRVYFREWAWELGAFFEGLTAESSDAELLAAAPGFPVFRLQPS